MVNTYRYIGQHIYLHKDRYVVTTLLGLYVSQTKFATACILMSQPSVLATSWSIRPIKLPVKIIRLHHYEIGSQFKELEKGEKEIDLFICCVKEICEGQYLV